MRRADGEPLTDQPDELKRLRTALNIVKTWVEIAWQRQVRIGHKLEALIDLLTERGIVADEDLDQRVKGAKGREWLAGSDPDDIFKVLLRVADRVDDATAAHLAQLSAEEAELTLRRLDAELFLRQEEKPRRGDPT